MESTIREPVKKKESVENSILGPGHFPPFFLKKSRGGAAKFDLISIIIISIFWGFISIF